MTIRAKAQGSIVLSPEEKAATWQSCFFSRLEMAFSNFSAWKIYNPSRCKPNATSFPKTSLSISKNPKILFSYSSTLVITFIKHSLVLQWLSFAFLLEKLPDDPSLSGRNMELNNSCLVLEVFTLSWGCLCSIVNIMAWETSKDQNSSEPYLAWIWVYLSEGRKILICHLTFWSSVCAFLPLSCPGEQEGELFSLSVDLTQV